MKRTHFLLTGTATALAGCGGHAGIAGLTPSAAQAPSSSFRYIDAVPLAPLPDSPIIGEFYPFDGAVVPQGWMICDGGMLNVADYPQLFSILDGRSNQTKTFALPKSRRRSVIAVNGVFPNSPAFLAATFAKRASSSGTRKP
jgi:hypothetical protein